MSDAEGLLCSRRVSKPVRLAGQPGSTQNRLHFAECQHKTPLTRNTGITKQDSRKGIGFVMSWPDSSFYHRCALIRSVSVQSIRAGFFGSNDEGNQSQYTWSPGNLPTAPMSQGCLSSCQSALWPGELNVQGALHCSLALQVSVCYPRRLLLRMRDPPQVWRSERSVAGGMTAARWP